MRGRSNRRVGKLADYPIDAWGMLDLLDMEEGTGLGKSVDIAPPEQPRLSFQLHEPLVMGGVRSNKAVDALIEKHVGPRR